MAEEKEIDLFKKAKTAEEFLSLLPPDAKAVILLDGSVGFRDALGKEYKPPKGIENLLRNIKGNVTPLAKRTTFDGRLQDDVGSGVTQEVDDSTGEVVSSTSDTFDYANDISLEEVELKKTAYGVDTIETGIRINDQGQEEKGRLERIGDRLYEIFVSGPTQTITEVSPVSGKTIARSVPAVEGVATAATMFTGLPVGQLANKMGVKFFERQTEEAGKAAIGVEGYGAAQVLDRSTGQIIDLTASPVGSNLLTKALGITDYSVGTYAESMATGPFVTPDGVEFSTMAEAANYIGQNKFTTKYGMERFIPAGETYASTRIFDPKLASMGTYDEDSGTIDAGFSRNSKVTGVAVDKGGNFQFKTGKGGFFTGGGELVSTGSGGFGYSGFRGDIIQGQNITSKEAQDLMNRINTGEITSTPRTTKALQEILGEQYYSYPPMTGILGEDEAPPITPFEIPIVPDLGVTNIGFSNVKGINNERFAEGESGVLYGGGYKFSETMDSDVYSDGFESYGDSFGEDQSTSTVDTQEEGQFSEERFGGRIGKQEGGSAIKPVNQIVQGAGFIAPQKNVTEEQTIADDIPIEAEEGDFIINAPAAQFAGRQDIVKMILEAIDSLREKGIGIQYGNPKIPMKKRVQLAVSRNEVYVPRVIAEEIGYDKLEKINNRGKKEVERRQQESEKQAKRGGFVGKANGGDIEDKSSLLLGTDEGSFLQDLGRMVIDKFGDKLKGFLSKEEEDKQPLMEGTKKDKKEEMLTPEPRPKSITEGLEARPFKKEEEKKYTNYRTLISDRLKELNLPKDKIETYELLNILEISPKIDPRKGNVPTNKSGLTVGIGFDIGKHNKDDLQKFGFSKPLYEKLLPYLEKIGAEVDKDPDFMLSNEELDEVNSKVLNKKFEQFDIEYPQYKDINPIDKTILYSVYHLGAMDRYETFREIYDESRSMDNALQAGVIDKIKERNSPERVRAKKALEWLRNKEITTMPTPILRPEKIRVNPDNGSFLSSSVRV